MIQSEDQVKRKIGNISYSYHGLQKVWTPDNRERYELGMFQCFFKLYLKMAFRLRLEKTDLIFTSLLIVLGAVDYFWPELGIDMDAIAWIIPTVILGLRLLFAPYFVWKEENLKNRALEDKYGDPRSPQKILGNKKTYSNAERHALSDMLSETKAFFDVDIRAAELEFQKLVPQISKITYIDSLEQFVRDAINKIDDINSKLDAIERKFAAWKHVYRGVLGTEIPNELTRLRQQLDRSIEPILAAQRLHAITPPERHNDISKLLTVVSKGVLEETAKVNGWIDQTLKRIASIEDELEKK